MNRSMIRHKTDAFVLTILILAFVSLIVFVPVTEYGDSYQYLHHMLSRDPVYAILLQILQKVFPIYTLPLSIIQNILAIICIYWTYTRVSSVFEFNTFGCLLTFALLVAPHIITPFASATHIVITCAVLTEGISLSLYYVWIGIIMSIICGYYGQKANNGILTGLLLSLIMSLIRGQFIICIVAWAIAVLYRVITDKKRKYIFIYACLLVLALASKKYVTNIYHFINNGVFSGTAASAPMLLTNMIYVMDESAIEELETEWVRDAVSDMYHMARDRELTSEYSAGNILMRAKHHENVHEILNFEVVTVVIDDFLHRYEKMDEGEYSIFLYYRDIYANRIIKELLPIVAQDYIRNVLITSTLGFIRSVAIDKGIISIYAVFIYIFSIVVTILTLRKNRTDMAGIMMIFTWILICGTVFGVSLIIECISRYMMYNLPFFYIVILAEFKNYGRIGNLRNI